MAKKPNQFNVDNAASARCRGKKVAAMGWWKHNGPRV